MQGLSPTGPTGQLLAPTAKARKLAMPRWADRAFLLVGLALLVYVVSRYPMAELGRACLRLGPWVAVTPLIALGWIACNTSALHLLLDREVPWLRLLKIRLIGDGYNALLPLAGFGGEPYRIKHISQLVPLDRVLSALIRDRVIENAVGMLFTASGLAAGIAAFVFAAPFRAALVTYIAFASVAGIVSVLVMVTSLPSRASSALARWLGAAGQNDVRLPASRFALVLIWYLAARIAGCCEITVLLHLLGLRSDVVTIVFCYSLLQAAGFVGFAIPAGIGVFEGTTVYLFSVLGFPGPLGVAFALARRGRMLIVGLFGALLHLASLSSSKPR